MRHVSSFALALVGLIHLLPLSGVLGAERLASLYGVPWSDPNALILMRHRAVLFGLVGMFLLFAAIRPALQSLALFAGGISVGSFLALALAVGGYNALMSRVVWVDAFAMACIAIGAVAFVFTPAKV